MLQAEQIIQNRYKLERQLGNNAARQTWLATDLSASDGKDSRVVVKLLAFGGTVQWDDLKLFEREAQILKHLEHSKIPKYIDYFSIELWIFTFRRSIKSGKIRDIRDVFQSIIRLGKEDNLQLESNQEKEMITIQTVNKRFSFGIGLSAQECLWIAQEIKDWLRGR